MALDPRTSDADARAWTLQLLRWLQWAEHESQLWYEALVEQISMGLVSCAEVTRYNQQAERLYYWQAWLWDKFDPMWTMLRGKGIAIPADPALPKLIGTVYNVYGGTRMNARFKVTVPCQPNGLANTQQLNAYGLPAGCYQREPDPGGTTTPIVWAGGVTDIGSSELLGLTVAEMVFGVVILAGAAYLVHEFSSTAHSVAGTIDGSTIANINAQMANRQLEQDRRRAEWITACQRDTLARMGGIGTGLTLDQLEAIRKSCEAGAIAAYPDRAPPFASTMGVTGVLLALGLVGGVVGTVYLLTRKPERHSRAA